MCQYCTTVFLVADYYNEMANVVNLKILRRRKCANRDTVYLHPSLASVFYKNLMKQNGSLHFYGGVFYLLISNVNPLMVWVALITKCNCYRINRWKFLPSRPLPIKKKKNPMEDR